MKRLIGCTLAVLLGLVAVYAQDIKKEDWKERIRSEKIAYLTMEVNLTPEEAQVFWPVYNAIWEDTEKAQKEVMEAFKALDDAVQAGKSEKEISAKLDAYIGSLEKKVTLNIGRSEQIGKVLPVEKVAKLYIAEEKFRFQQMRKLHHPNNGGKPAPQQSQAGRRR